MLHGRRVAITGADGQVGKALLSRLREIGCHTIALTRKPTQLPADRLIAGPLDAAAARDALKEAACVIHLAGTLRPLGRNSYQAANVGTTQVVADALRHGRASRVLFLSYVGARKDSSNPYLRTKAVAERLLRDTRKEVAIFRCTHIIGKPETPGPTADAMLVPPGRRVTVLGSGRQVVAPVYRGDVVSALMAALEGAEPGTYDLAGPDRMSLDDLARLLNRDPRIAIRHIPDWVARLLGTVVPTLPSALVDLMLRDSMGDSTVAARALGLHLTSLATVWDPRPFHRQRTDLIA